MDDILQQIRGYLWSIYADNDEYFVLFGKNALSREYGWNKRVDDIFHREGPSAFSKLFLELRLNEKIKVSDYLMDSSEYFPWLRSIALIDDHRLIWLSALREYGDSDPAKFFIEQLRTLSWEMKRAITNLKLI